LENTMHLPRIKSRVWITASCCLLAVAVAAWAQGRKAGLWEMTTTMTMQQSPVPPGMTPPANSPLSPGQHVTQVCLTQEMIDKYGAPPPQSRDRDCQFTNVQKGDHGMTADMVCSGRMTGKGTVKSEWSDPEHATGEVHFTGTVQGRNGERPLEWTSQSTSVFKSADCGDVKPVGGN
jgi:hypothetical protein